MNVNSCKISMYVEISDYQILHVFILLCQVLAIATACNAKETVLCNGSVNMLAKVIYV